MQKKTYKKFMRVNMKTKNFVLLMLGIVAMYGTKASVANYTFGTSVGNYTAITGTTLFTSSTTRFDDGTSALQTLPFTFTYNGLSFTTLGVSSNGYITLGAVPGTSTNYCGLQASDAYSIAGYATDLVGVTTGATPSTVIVGTRGTAPSRQYVIQWTDVAHYTSGTYVDHWNFQIILNETTNTVQVVWGTSTDVTSMVANNCADAQTESGDVGLLGSSVTDFNLRSVTNGTNTWSTSVAGSAITAVCNMSSTNIPASGTTFTWTPAPLVAMSYVSSTTAFLNSFQALPLGSTNNQILQVQVVTTGSLTPITMNSFSLTTTGCTNASTDLSNARVFFTGISGTYSTSTQFGTTTANPNGTYTINGTATLAEGINYFWVSYDVRSTATFGDNLSGCCTQITGSMGSATPTVTCPSGTQSISQVGTWTPVAAVAPHANLGHMLLLSDGTVICKSNGGPAYGNIWDKLTPDAQGSYVNGTWSTITPMNDTRLFFSSQVLMDGRVYVAGGEYGTGLATGEVYNPLTNVWTSTPSPGGNVSDANSEILPDGRVLQALVAGALTGTSIYNPTTNTYVTGPTAHGIHNESSWVKLPDNSILYVDRLTTSSERYIPATNTWIVDANLPVSLYDPYGDETGAGFLLPDGRAFFLGSMGHTAYYTPSGSTSPGVWAAGPDIPSAKGTPDAAAAMMVNGKIICAVSPVPTSANHFPTPTTFYEFDYTSNSYALLNAPGGGASLNIGAYQTNFLDLPDGSVLYGQNQTSTSSQYYIYTPAGSPLAAGKPLIANISQSTCTSFNITGTKFNGISEGACYGDDGQMATNYPVIRLTSGSNVYYARTSNWNSTGVQTGSLPTSTDFTLPSGLPTGTYSLVVTANGIASDPITFNALPTLTSTLTPPAICSGTAFTYNPTSTRTNGTFTWTRAAVSGISNAAITTPQSAAPNEILINTTSSPISVIYSYAINAGTCSNTQNVTVVVNPLPTVSSTTTTSAVCVGSSVTMSGTGATSYTWSGGVNNGVAFTPSATTTYTVTGTDANTCLNTATRTITVNALPTVGSTTTASAVCAGTSVTMSGTGATSYTWSGGVNNGVAFTPSATTTYTVTGTDANTCSNTSTRTITVNALPTVGSTTTASSVCAGTSVTMSGIGATSYSWSGGVNNGVAFTPITTTTYTVTGTDANTCSNTSTRTITVNALPTVGSTTTASAVCAGSSVTMSGTGADSYSWTGGVVDGTSFSPSATDTYTVTGTTNGCSNTATQTITVTSQVTWYLDVDNDGYYVGSPVNSCTSPGIGYNTTATILGDCDDANSGVYQTGSLFVDADGDGYSNGTVILCYGANAPTGYSFTSNGTDCNDNDNSIHATSSITASAGANGSISPSGVSNFCGGNQTYSFTPNAGFLIQNVVVDGNNLGMLSSYTFSTITSNHTIVVNFIANSGCSSAPASPAISGPNAVCGMSTGIYTATSATANSFAWTMPAGLVITSGQGTSLIHVNYLTGTINGNIVATATNACGTSAATNYIITKKPQPPSAIAGPTSLCGMATANYSATSFGATSYTWSLPAGITLTSGSGTSSINVAIASTFAAGNISVIAVNACGSLAGTAITVVGKVPAATTAIAGLTSVCGVSTITYTATGIPGASSYVWTLPTGFTQLSATGNSITVQNTGFVSGSISVRGVNGCGIGAIKTLVLTAATATPGIISGPTVTCGLSSATYSIVPVSGATNYIWSLPAGATIFSGAGTASIVATFTGGMIGTVGVMANNGCANSVLRTLAVSKVPAAPGAITGPTVICGLGTVSYSIAAVAGATNYLWVAPAGTSIASGQGTTSVVVNVASSAFAAGLIRVYAQTSCGNSPYSGLTFGACASPLEISVADKGNAFSSIYPNPTSSNFTLDVTVDSDQELMLEVFDISGNIVITEKHNLVSGTSTMITNMEKFDNGIYFVRILDADRNVMHTERVVKQ